VAKLRTENLIAALVADGPSGETPISRTLTVAAAIGAAIAALAFFAILGFRADITAALETVRYQTKLLVTAALLLPALPLVWHYARPNSNGLGWITLLLIVSPSILAIACTLEMAAVPSADWAARLYGTGPTKCLLSIPFLSIAPLSALLYGLSQGAPTKPVVAGSVAGLASAAFAAMLYASNCINDSPLFVAAWYTTAIALVTIAGGLLGSRLLRW
jgi:hypothetical protein